MLVKRCARMYGAVQQWVSIKVLQSILLWQQTSLMGFGAHHTMGGARLKNCFESLAVPKVEGVSRGFGVTMPVTAA